MGFTIVDVLVVHIDSIAFFLAGRASAAMVAIAVRWCVPLRRSTLFALTCLLPFAAYVQIIPAIFDLWGTHYVVGLVEVVFVSSALTPMRLRHALVAYTLVSLPAICVFLKELIAVASPTSIHGLATCCGVISLASLNGLGVRMARLGKLRAETMLNKQLRTQQRKLAAQFSPKIARWLQQASSNGEPLKRRVTIVVVDIKDSTLKAATLAPDAYARAIGSVLDVIVSACHRHDLIIDKFTGDGVQAIAGFPDESRDSLSAALRCCQEIQLACAAFSLRARDIWQGDIAIRCAACETEALVGFIGRAPQQTFSAIGEGVSLTHRLCGAALGGQTLTFSTVDPQFARRIHPSGTLRVLTNLKGFGARTFGVCDVGAEAQDAPPERVG
ncbi:MAG: adenylate/guanylate cyclase domain-containing protein [Phycisphaerales bacterium]